MSNGHADPCVLVIFGATGDLTRRKLLPAIANLARSGHLPQPFVVVGVARQAMDDAAFRAQMRERLEDQESGMPPDTWTAIEPHLYLVSGGFDDPLTYSSLRHRLTELTEREGAPANYLFYFAIPPDLFSVVARQLGDAGLANQEGGWRRVIIEKPFGYDLTTARALNADLAGCFSESQIYRIDHYLGKETVQNILAFRFANGIFEPIWNRRYVDHVQMTVAETVGVEGRGGYYDHAGALRDMVQNHMFQLLALVAMEPPISFRAEDVRDEKAKLLHAVLPLAAADLRRDIVRGQYTGNAGTATVGYREEPSVSPSSSTETFLAMRLHVDNWRWAGVPFYLRTGKRLARRVTEIVVEFKRAPFTLFRETPVACTNPNALVLRIQPDEGISLAFDAKVPGPLEQLHTVTMDFGYSQYFKTPPSTGYETLLFDAMAGDQTLFHRMDMVEAGWQIVEPLLQAWKTERDASVATYEAGSWGPAEADLLMDRDDRQWRS